jgi:hypothetical protein
MSRLTAQTFLGGQSLNDQYVAGGRTHAGDKIMARSNQVRFHGAAGIILCSLEVTRRS